MKFLSRLAAVTGTVLLAAGAAGCAAGAPVPPPVPPPHLPTLPATLTARQAATLQDYGRADTAFGMDVLGAVCRSQPGANLVLSPASLASGLGMAYLGARGATAAAMSQVLHLPATSTSALVAGLRARAELLGSLNRPGVTFTVSNRIWADPSVVTNSGYLAQLRAGYGAQMAHVPLLAKPESARQTINATVAADTAGHIGALMPPGSLNQVAWVLTDALYLKAAWLSPFDPAQTQPGPFTTGTGQRVTARYLHGSYFRYATAGGWTAVQLPYRGGRLAMLALLPPAGGGCPALAGTTLGDLTAELKAPASGPSGQAGQASVALPRVDLSTSESMNDVLKRMGMGVAFTAAADFTGLSPQACCIGLVQHAATLQVGEKGTVASAATGVALLPTAARPALGPEVVFNRPYLLMVDDTMTGEPLMLARVTDPAAG
jgi:serine protease inhibitor